MDGIPACLRHAAVDDGLRFQRQSGTADRNHAGRRGDHRTGDHGRNDRGDRGDRRDGFRGGKFKGGRRDGGFKGGRDFAPRQPRPKTSGFGTFLGNSNNVKNDGE